MAKKKKSQLKPVARGFATTSVPKKPVAADVDPAPFNDDVFQRRTEAVNREVSGEGGAFPVRIDYAVSNFPNEREFDPIKAEEQSLQNMVDKHQEKTEKEITRTVKVCFIILCLAILPCQPHR